MITDLHASQCNIIEIENMHRELCVGETHLDTVPMSLLPTSLSWSALLNVSLSSGLDQFIASTTMMTHIPSLSCCCSL